MTTKTFDAVRLMRKLRDRLSGEMQQMTPDERVRYILSKAESTDLGRKIADEQNTAQR